MRPSTRLPSREMEGSDAFHVALVACKSMPGDLAANLRNHLRWAERAIARGVHFIGFPECSLTGYALRPEIAIRIDGQAVGELTAFARTNGVFISAGLVERRGRRFFNSQFLAGPAGFMGVMSKINVTKAESAFFSGASGFPVFRMNRIRLGIAICADATHFETPHLLALRGATVIFCPHATYLQHTPASWLHWRMERWPLFARDCAAWILGCNNAGLFESPRSCEEDSGFASGALIVDPEGRAVARSRIRRNRETVVLASLPVGEIARYRDRFSMTDIRGDIFYRGLLPGK